MTRPKVVNITRAICSTYIGRFSSARSLDASKWANPFKIEDDSQRADAIEQYRQHVFNSPELLLSLRELAGETLGCWCTPKACHGDLLAAFVEALPADSAVVELRTRIMAKQQCDADTALAFLCDSGLVSDLVSSWSDVAESDAIRALLRKIRV